MFKHIRVLLFKSNSWMCASDSYCYF